MMRETRSEFTKHKKDNYNILIIIKKYYAFYKTNINDSLKNIFLEKHEKVLT